MSWSKADFLNEATRIGGSGLAEAHAAFLAALSHAGTPATFDGTGKKQATYTVRVGAEAHWHILRVWANGYVILMLNHLRGYAAPSIAARAKESFHPHLRSNTRNCPYLAHNGSEFGGMDFDSVARLVRDVADAARWRD